MKLKALFVQTTNSGIAFYRMHNFVVSAHRRAIFDAHHLWWQKDLHTLHPWETDIRNPEMMWRITKEMQDWLVMSDVVIFQMLHLESGLELLRAMKDMCPTKPIFAETDDNFLSTPDYNSAGEFYNDPGSEMRRVAIAQFKESDGMIVSTPYLKDLYSEFNSNIHVVPNCIDFEIWDKTHKKNKSGIRIGWMGGANHDEDLRIVAPIIPRIVKQFKEVKFVFVHGLPSFMRGIEGVEYVKSWAKIDKYPQKIAEQDFDIGIAPLVDNAFNRGKSNLRWLEYSALRIPTIASNVGHFAETIKNGVDGYLVDDEKQWEERLIELILDKKKRIEMGKAANARIRKDFNTDIVTKTYHDILRQATTRNSEVLA